MLQPQLEQFFFDYLALSLKDYMQQCSSFCRCQSRSFHIFKSVSLRIIGFDAGFFFLLNHAFESLNRLFDPDDYRNPLFYLVSGQEKAAIHTKDMQEFTLPQNE